MDSNRSSPSPAPAISDTLDNYSTMPYSSPMTHLRVILEHIELDAWADPWGKPITAHVVDDYITLTPIDGCFHAYHNGYTNEAGQVYVTDDGDTCYAESPIDYCGSTRYVWLDGRRVEAKIHPYTRPTEGVKYVFDGQPVRWSREENDFLDTVPMGR